MLRKLCMSAVATGALVAGSLGLAGTANAAEPVHNVAASGIGGLGGGVCSVVGGVLSGIGCPGDGHRLGGSNWRGDNWRNNFRGGHFRGGNQTIIVGGNSFGLSDCGCGDNQVLLTPVVQRQVELVPVGAIAAGDGSCGLNSRAFGRFGDRFGGIHRGFVR